MSQQTFSSGGTQLAEPPAPVVPFDESGSGGDDNRRKLMVVGAVVGVVVLAIVAFFLMKGGGSSSDASSSFTPPHHTHAVVPAAAQPPVVKLPKHVAAPVGRDPFKPLYVAPAAAKTSTGSTSSTSTTPSTSGSTPTTTTTGGTGTTTPTTTPTYQPVWVQLKSVTPSWATFDVGLSNGKTLKAVRYVDIRPLHTFRNFELLSIRDGVVTVKYGDGTPFELDRTHNTMVVD